MQEDPAYGAWGHLWVGSPRIYKKEAWAITWDKNVTGSLSMLSASAPASGTLPYSSPCPNFLKWWIKMWKCKPNNPFLAWLSFWSSCFIKAIRTLTKTTVIRFVLLAALTTTLALYYLQSSDILSKNFSTRVITRIPKLYFQFRYQSSHYIMSYSFFFY